MIASRRVIAGAVILCCGLGGVVLAAACSSFSGDNRGEDTDGGVEGGNPDAVADASDAGCTTGACVEVLATGQSGAFGIAVDDDSVYFTTKVASGSVIRCPKAGCGATPDVLATGQNAPYGVAVDGAGVYWTSSGDSSLRVLPKGSHGPGTELRDGGSPTALLVTGGMIYWLDTLQGSINSCAVVGCAPGFNHIFLTEPEGLAVAGGDTYWTAGGVGGYVAVSPPLVAYNQEPFYVANGPSFSFPHAIAVDDTNLYVAAGAASGVVVTVPRTATADGGSPPTTLAKDRVNPFAVIVDENFVYFTTRGVAGQSDGTVERVGKAGDNPKTIATKQGAPAFLAQDADYVYWTNSADGTVMRARKSSL